MMKSVDQELTLLKAHLNRIEKQNNRLKQLIISLAILLVPLFLLGAKPGMNDAQFGHLTARGLTILDSSGKELVGIGTKEKEGTTGIRIFNKSGKRIMSLGVPADGQGNGIMIADAEGRPRIGLGMDKGIPGIALTNSKGVNFIAMGGNKDGYGLQITDSKEVRRIGLGFNAGNAGIMLYDQKGQYVRGMIRQEDGMHYASYIDGEGKEIIFQ